MTLRALKRKSSLDPDQDLDEVVKAEFRRPNGAPDLRLSVYVKDSVPDEDRHRVAVQIQARHAVSFLGDPPSRAVTVDLEGAKPIALERSPGVSAFDDLNAMHHEVLLEDAAALRGLAARMRAADPHRFAFRIDRATLVDEAKDGEDAGETGWVDSLKRSDRKAWRRRVDRAR